MINLNEVTSVEYELKPALFSWFMFTLHGNGLQRAVWVTRKGERAHDSQEEKEKMG